MKAIILAAGRGSRLTPLTDNLPKALVPIGDITLIERILASLPNVVTEIIIIMGIMGEMIENKIGPVFENKKVFYQKQRADMKGTWAAISSAESFMSEESFLVLNCDDLFQKTELEQIIARAEIGMGVTETLMPDSYYGIDFDKTDQILGFRKRPNPTHKELVEDWFANGLYILDKRIFYFEPIPVYGGEYGLPQTLFQNLTTYPLKALKINNWQACNNFEDLKRIN